MFSLAAVYDAWRQCRRRKRGTRNAQRYEMHAVDHLVDTAHALAKRRWRPSRAVAFVVDRPKCREILAADFGDRVVHHLLVPWLERQFEPVFIHDSYSNRKSKGTHAAVNRLRTFLRCAPAGERRHAWYLQLDIGNFFNSIDRRRLFGFIRARLDRDAARAPGDRRHLAPAVAGDLLWLTRVLLTGNAAEGAHLRGDPTSFARVPAHKRLCNAPAERGLPIGNLTSQFFANVYLNELDQFVKHTLKARHYVRYVDDFVLLHDDPEVLDRWRDRIATFLDAQLGLRLRDAGELRPAANGSFGLRDRHRLRATLASYLGHFRHADAHRLIDGIWQRHRWLAHWYERGADARLITRCEPTGNDSLHTQWSYFRRRYPGARVLIQVGNRAELLGPDAIAVGAWPNHGGRTVRRPGFAGEHGALSWPLARRRTIQRRIVKSGSPMVWVEEDGWLACGRKRRVLAEVSSDLALHPPRPNSATRGKRGTN